MSEMLSSLKDLLNNMLESAGMDTPPRGIRGPYDFDGRICFSAVREGSGRLNICSAQCLLRSSARGASMSSCRTSGPTCRGGGGIPLCSRSWRIRFRRISRVFRSKFVDLEHG